MFKIIRSVKPNKKVTAQQQRLYASAKTANIDWNPVRSKKQLSQGIEFGGKTSSKVFLGLLCLAPIITFALGTWQVKRLKWKNKLVAECEDRLTYKPIPMPKNVTKEDLPNLEYRKVLVTGHFDYSREAFVGPRLHDTRRGYTLVCPFVQSNGAGEVLIDRGWIAAEKVIPSQRNLQHLSVPKGEITVECVIRVPPKKGIFNIDHDKGSRLYQYLDADTMAEELGSRPIYLQALQNFHDKPDQHILDTVGDANKKTGSWAFWKSSNPSTASSSMVPGADTKSLDYDTAEEFDPLQFINAGVPLGKIPKVDYKNNHLNYLVTWYSLSFASTALLIYMFKKGKFINPTEEKLKYTKKIMN
ncbi:hypothetical protein PMKS-001328 [Pichia membranifaciens]|uniref:SURF1-like protein n=1 Tax=Pichia membranifaciens TaxID=4926 RepID=A0A1Q2YE84_9ASCO|nr:hypothetical protein PMKS-001328 [Pichia membranifaciens]